MQYTKIIVPETSYDKALDSRLLIPFVHFGLIGFYNNNGEIVVKPQYTQYDGECYNEDDFVKVARLMTFGFHRGDDRVATYHKHLWGLIDSKGKIILPLEYEELIPAIGNKCLFTSKKHGAYSVINIQGEEIVPNGKYQYIDGFDNGLARVNVYGNGEGLEKIIKKWGLINEKGEEVLPPVYDNIWNFYEKRRQTTMVIKDGIFFDYNLI